MINLNQSIAKVKGEVLGGDFTRDDLIAAIAIEGNGRDRVTLLEWLCGQAELLPAEAVPEVPVEVYATGVPPQGPPAPPPPPRATPVYRPEMRGGVWCLYDVNNGELRSETFENKGEASVFAERLEAGEELDEPYLHVSRA